MRGCANQEGFSGCVSACNIGAGFGVRYGRIRGITTSLLERLWGFDSLTYILPAGLFVMLVLADYTLSKLSRKGDGMDGIRSSLNVFLLVGIGMAGAATARGQASGYRQKR